MLMSEDHNTAHLPQNMGKERNKGPYVSQGGGKTGAVLSEQRQKPIRLNSQQNKRSNVGNKGIDAGAQAIATEGHGRPLTKHQQRTRISNSQGGIRKRPLKQPFSANPNASSGLPS